MTVPLPGQKPMEGKILIPCSSSRACEAADSLFLAVSCTLREDPFPYPNAAVRLPLWKKEDTQKSSVSIGKTF